MSNTVDFDSTQHNVASVTVYQTNCAEVTRKVKIQLKDGQNDVEIRNLPTCIDEDSIRVDGIGNAVILDVIYHPFQHSKDDPFKVPRREMNEQETALNAELAILKRESTILRDYARTLKSSDADPTKLASFLDIYKTRQREIDEVGLETSKRIDAIHSGWNETVEQIKSEVKRTTSRGVRITVVVMASGGGEAELSLTYLVSNARWAPQYDVRAAIAQDSRSQSTVALHYRASISQRTGEDWTGVDLTLSTASPSRGTEIPKLRPLRVNTQSYPYYHDSLSYYPPSIIRTVSSYSRSRSRSPSSWRSRSPSSPPHSMVLPSRSRSPSPPRTVTPARRRSRSLSSDSDYEQVWEKNRTLQRREAAVENKWGDSTQTFQPPQFFTNNNSKATDGAVSTTFAIPGLSTIPSTSDDGQQTHKVSIAEMCFDSVEMGWITVPREVTSVFVQCRVKNTSKYVLLPGPANIFMNCTFVAKSNIPHVSPQEYFSCSLGVDPAVRVTYHPLSRKSKTSRNVVLTNKTTSTTYEQTITIKNTRLSRLRTLLVKEQLPVTSDAKVKVSIIEPSGLQFQSTSTAAKKSPRVTSTSDISVSESVKARWVPRHEGGQNRLSDAATSSLVNDTKEAGNEAAQGLMEWVCNVAPGASVDLKLSWEVSAPSDTYWGYE